ncbi:sdnD, partial [Symbiodinium necroappetens]
LSCRTSEAVGTKLPRRGAVCSRTVSQRSQRSSDHPGMRRYTVARPAKANVSTKVVSCPPLPGRTFHDLTFSVATSTKVTRAIRNRWNLDPMTPMASEGRAPLALLSGGDEADRLLVEGKRKMHRMFDWAAGILRPMEATCIWLFPAFVAGSILWAVSCKIFYRIRGEFGKDLVIQRFGQHAFHVVSGDYSSKLIYEEIFRKKVYFKRGVSLDGFDDRQDRQEKERKPCGPLVLDVGGNLGFFSAFVAEHFRGSRIHIFEPLPLLVNAISLNLASYGCVVFRAHDGQTLLRDAPDGTRVVVHQTALGAHETELPLTYQSRMLAGSSLVPERFLPSNIDKIQFLQAMYLDSVTLGALPAFPTRFLCQLLGVPWLRIPIFLALTPLMILRQIQQRLSGNRQLVFRTPVRTLSSILKEQGLLGKTVDLLKVDVEGAEWDVLMGIDEQIWPCLRQLVIEVHDGDDGRVQKIMELCKGKGFKVMKMQEEAFELPKLCKIFLIFATR